MNAPEELLIKTTTAPPVRTPHRTENDNEECWRSLWVKSTYCLSLGWKNIGRRFVHVFITICKLSVNPVAP